MVPKTKVRILQTALKLYNEHGVYNPHGEQITARRIAAELNMSDGNLRYHFPSREDIVRGLYDELVEKLNAEFSVISVETVNWAAWLAGFHRIYQLLYEYRFLMRDFVGIMQHQPELKLHFRFLQKERKAMFRKMLKALQSEGFLRPEPMQGQYERLYDQLQILSDFWIASSELMYEGKPDAICKHYAHLSMSLFIPYMSVLGLEQWEVAMKPSSTTAV